MLKWDGCGNNFLTETRVKVATVATVVDGCENNDPGLFFNRLIIYTSVVNHYGSDGSENNDSRRQRLKNRDRKGRFVVKLRRLFSPAAH